MYKPSVAVATARRGMRLLGRYQGRCGQIEVVEFQKDGSRLYFEEGVHQSQAAPDGESQYTYVKLMDALLAPAANVLVLGCGGGTLGTMLFRQGKRVTVVDHNPISFVIARQFFALPAGVSCIVSDFRDFLFRCTTEFDGIAIDVGGPGFSFSAEFDMPTCRAVRAALVPNGRIVMNMMVDHDLDPVPDRIARRLSGGALQAQIFDEPGIPSRNAVIACVRERHFSRESRLWGLIHNENEAWVLRKPRVRRAGPNAGNSARVT
jgi:spermidine synthase